MLLDSRSPISRGQASRELQFREISMAKKITPPELLDLTSIIRKVQENVEGFFQQQLVIQQNPFSGKGTLLPATDIYETADKYVVKIEMPGVQPDQIDISFIGNKLTIRGTRPQHLTEPRCSFHQMEILYGDFERSICLPETIPAEGIRAEYDRAFLFVTIEKRPSKKTKQVIVIKPSK